MTMPNIAQLGAEVATTAAISVGAKDNPTKLARAKVAATIAGFFTAAAAGDFNAINSVVQTFLATQSDPGLVLVGQNLWSLGQPWLQIEMTVADALPTLQAALAGIGSGMATAAGAYIQKFGTAS